MKTSVSLDNYIRDLKHLYEESIRTGQMTPELSFRPLLDVFLQGCSKLVDKEVERVFEPKQQANSGRPDWRFYNSRSLGVYGYVEAKPLDPKTPLNPNDYSDQIEKYRRLGQPVILTDGIDFIFYYPQADRVKISLSDKPLKRRGEWPTSREARLLIDEFRRFLTKPTSRRVTEQQLIEECALRAQLLAEGIESLCVAPRGSGLSTTENNTISILLDLKELVTRHHDPLMANPKFFADFVAQVLIFGMIYTHRIIGSTEKEPRSKYAILKQFWERHGFRREIEQLRPFCVLGRQLKAELGTLGVLGTWFEDCALMLSYVQLDEEQEKNPDFHKLFESFFAKYDPKTRFDYGAFYTPSELTSYMVTLVEAIADKDFHDVELYDDRNKLMDPCCGTGSFLERLYLASNALDHKPTIVGFEILPAPYALAHYRITMLSKVDPANVRIVLTNTLSDDLESRTNKLQLGMLHEEQREARELARPPLTLIIGNPPSSDSFHASQGKSFSIIQELLDDFRPPDLARRGRQNVQKQVQNEHMKFLRWSANKIMESEKGILALVLPLSFLDSTSYKFARKWLFDHFNNIYVLEIDKDARAGVRASSIFNTLQGRALLVATRLDGAEESQSVALSFGSIANLGKVEKLGYFTTMAQNQPKVLSQFRYMTTSTDDYSLRPVGEFNREKYASYLPLFKGDDSEAYVFQRHCSGLKLAPSSMFVHSDKGLLMRRTQDIGNPRKTVDEIIRTWYSRQDKPPTRSKFGDLIRKTFASLAQSQIPKRYSYRPFLNVWAVISEEVLQLLASIGGGGTRYRPEVISAFEENSTIGIAVAPSRREIGAKLHRFASFCWYLPDNDLCSRGNAHVFCNQFPAYKKGRSWDRTPTDNVNPDLLKSLNVTTDDVVFYVYAVLCSNVYLDEFEAALYTGSDVEQQPRIPMAIRREEFLEVSRMGKRLAELERPSEPSREALNQWSSGLYEEVELGFRLERFVLDNSNESITLIDDVSRMVIELKPIPAEVIEYQVGGYRVIQQWLKFLSRRYTRTDFTTAHLIELLLLLQNIREQIEVIARIDIAVERIIG